MAYHQVLMVTGFDSHLQLCQILLQISACTLDHDGEFAP